MLSLSQTLDGDLEARVGSTVCSVRFASVSSPLGLVASRRIFASLVLIGVFRLRRRTLVNTDGFPLLTTQLLEAIGIDSIGVGPIGSFLVSFPPFTTCVLHSSKAYLIVLSPELQQHYKRTSKSSYLELVSSTGESVPFFTSAGSMVRRSFLDLDSSSSSPTFNSFSLPESSSSSFELLLAHSA